MNGRGPTCRTGIPGGLLLLLSILTGCAPPPLFPEVPILAPIPPSDATAQIPLRQVIFALSPLQAIGRESGGLVCAVWGNRLWEDLLYNLNQQQVAQALLRAHPTVSLAQAGLDGLSPVTSGPPPNIGINASIIDLRMDICWPEAGSKDFNYALGKIYMKVKWQFMTDEGKRQPFMTHTEGESSFESRVTTEEMFNVAFEQAIRGLQHNVAGRK